MRRFEGMVGALAVLLLASCAQKLEGVAPTLTGAQPQVVCNEQLDTDVTLTGDGFSPVVFDALTNRRLLTLPRVTLTQATDLGGTAAAGAPVTIPDDPTDPSASRVRWWGETRLSFQVFPALMLPAGIYGITVANANGKSASLPGALAVVPRPTVLGVSRPEICVAQGPQSLIINGTGFLRVGAAAPTVTIAGAGGSKTYAAAASGCTEVAGFSGVQLCTSLEISVPENDLPPGDYLLTVTNPAPAGCSSTESIPLRINPPPTITSVAVTNVDPPRICESGGTVAISGTGFRPGAAGNLSLPAGPSVDAFENQVAPDGTTLTSTFGPGLRQRTERYTVTVRNPDGCSVSVPDALQVTRGIFTFFVDPPVVYNGINTKVTILATGIESKPTEVRLFNTTASSGFTLSFSGNEIEWDPARKQRVQVTIPRDVPAGTAPVGSYNVGLADGTGCLSFLENGLQIVSETKLATTAISPPFGWTSSNTPVVIEAAASPPPGEVNFAAVPRGYLSPVSDPSAAAVEIRALSFVSPTRLTGVVPTGLTAGTYNVIIVNPSGVVGVLSSAFEVTAAAPPLVDSVSPGTLRTNEAAASLSITGANFRTAAVRLTCRLPGTATEVPVEAAGEVVSAGGTQIDMTVNTESPLANGMVCVVRVTNEDDGTWFDFSAVTIDRPAQGTNPLNFLPGTEMKEARRAPAGVAARATRTARFVYAIGGDDGTAAGAKSTVEAATVGLFGELGEWFPLPVGLSEGNPATGGGALTSAKRTLAGAVRVGRFLFLVGGHDGSVGSPATAKVLRAQVLSPNDAPKMGDPDLLVDDAAAPTDGLPGGVWSYRVSALLADSEGHNPGGETLASDPLVIRVPATEFKVSLRICWVPPGGVTVTKHRIYRTTAPSQAGGQERLLAECPGSTGCSTTLPCYDDVARETGSFADAQKPPLPLGSTGVWHEVAAMGVARRSVGVAAIALNDGARTVVYSVGGTSDGATGLASYEYLVVNADGTLPAMAAWVPGTGNALANARYELQLLTATAATAPRVNTDAWLYAAGGRGALRAVSAAKVDQTTGNLEAWIEEVDDDNSDRAGYAGAIGNNFLYLVGGVAGAPSASGSKAEICANAQQSSCGGSSPIDPPDLVNWNSTDTGMMRERYLPGQAVQSSFWYLLGGVTTGGAATKTTDISVLGGQQ